MAKLTPTVNTSGKYKVQLPWRINENSILTCLAVRSFDDIYNKNEDVYEVYYERYGLTNGLDVNGQPFDFDKERLLLPNIITLVDAAGGIYYVPDTFITSMPTQSDIPYSERIMSVSLGPMPDALEIDNIVTEVMELIKSKTGMTNVNIVQHSLALLDNPTYDEHLAMERVRKASLANATSVFEELAKANAEIARQNALIAKYEATLTGR